MDLNEAAGAIRETAVLGTLQPERAALVLLHWQRDVVAHGGAMGAHFADAVASSGAVERTAALAASVRAAGGEVVYANVAYAPDHSDVVANGPVWAYVAQSGALRRHTAGVEVIDELAPAVGDLVVEHGRTSIFADTSFDAWCRGKGITTLLFAGVATNVAVESSARAAVDAGFWTVLVEDCCVAATAEAHRASVQTQRAILSEVATSYDVREALERAHEQAR